MDIEILTYSNVESLIAILPTEAELSQLKEYEGHADRLGSPEKFFLEISKVKGYTEILHGLKHFYTYEEHVEIYEGRYSKLNQYIIQQRL